MKFSHKIKGVIEVKFIYSVVFLVAVFSFSSNLAFAQENEAVVIDEVVAQINDSVLTLSSIKRDMKEAVAALVQKGVKKEDAEKEVEGNKGEFIAGLIIDELLIQKGKEAGMDNDVDAQINQRFIQYMKEFKLKSLEQLYEAMRSQGVKPEELRESWRKQIMRENVMQREVDGKVYWQWTSTQLKDYYEKNKQKFTKPASVSISDIFLNFAGRDEAAVREKAKQLVEKLRNGEDFEKVAIENSDNPDVKETKGKRPPFVMSELNEEILVPIKATKVGGIADPIEVEGGIMILKVDAKTEASNESVFDEDIVRRAITMDELPAARKKFLSELRRDSFVKLADGYKDLVTPHLNKEDAPTTGVAKSN